MVRTQNVERSFFVDREGHYSYFERNKNTVIN